MLKKVRKSFTNTRYEYTIIRIHDFGGDLKSGLTLISITRKSQLISLAAKREDYVQCRSSGYANTAMPYRDVVALINYTHQNNGNITAKARIPTGTICKYVLRIKYNRCATVRLSISEMMTLCLERVFSM